jgi:hypothetical protein
MPTAFTLSQEAYEALIKLAADGTKNPDGTVNQEKALILDAFLRDIEEKNGFTRSLLWIQWQEAGTELPPTALFPKVWPPELRYRLEFVTRKISKDDVLTILAQKARKPVNVLVTSDPAALVGWAPLDDYFTQP